MICPGNMGGKNWPPTAYHPDLKMWYIPVIESCNQIKVQPMVPGKSFKPREFFTGGGPSQPERITGSLTAIDVTTGKVVAKHETKFPLLGGVLATPDLVFTGHPRASLRPTTRRRWSSSGSSAPAPASTPRR